MKLKTFNNILEDLIITFWKFIIPTLNFLNLNLKHYAKNILLLYLGPKINSLLDNFLTLLCFHYFYDFILKY